MDPIYEEKRLEERARERCADPKNPDPVEFAEALDKLMRDDPKAYAAARKAREAEAARIERRDNPEEAQAARRRFTEQEDLQSETETRWREEHPEWFGEQPKAPSAKAVEKARRLMAEAEAAYRQEGFELIHGGLLHESVRGSGS